MSSAATEATSPADRPAAVSEGALAAPPIRLTVQGLVVVGGLVALADWLLYARSPGIAFALFIAALAAGALATNTIRTGRGSILLGAGLLVAGLLPFVVNPSALSFVFAVAAIALFAVILFANPGPLVSDTLAAARKLLASFLVRAPIDVGKALVSVAGRRPQSLVGSLARSLVVWFMPIAFGLVFAWLFVGANPLLASWVSAIDLRAWARALADRLDAPRIAFWLIVLLVIWPVIFVREYRRRAARAAKPAAVAEPSGSLAQMQVIGTAAILRSLIVFNAIFAVQAVLDGLYLWGGLALPQGMSYAEYAHRGAYPLIATALLAAAFVVVALRPGSESERTPLIRALVYVWIAQNVWLVISSILRLDLYVAAYSLTYWRVAAFVWMVLVAVGLILILARIALGRSSRWLIGANLGSLTLVLYACAFPNFARIIADYNVAHSAEMGGGGPALDRHYLQSLGLHAIPAADAFGARNVSDGDAWNRFSSQLPLPSWREEAAAALRSEMRDWRAWSYWDWQLVRYLDANPSPAAPAPTETPG